MAWLGTLVGALVAGIVVLRDGNDNAAARPTTTTSVAPTTALPPDSVIFTDDFANPSTGWGRYDNDVARAEYANGTYRLMLHQARQYRWSWPAGGADLRDVSVEVEARNASAVTGQFGLICRYGGSGKEFYAARINQSGFWEIFRQSTNPNSRMSLTSGSTTFPGRADRPEDLVYRLRLDCSGGDRTMLVLFVNGVKVGEATDGNGLPPGRPGVTIGSGDKAGLDVVFDNFVVRRLP